jgi:hypothetical protein
MEGILLIVGIVVVAVIAVAIHKIVDGINTL